MFMFFFLDKYVRKLLTGVTTEAPRCVGVGEIAQWVRALTNSASRRTRAFGFESLALRLKARCGCMRL